jgi:hypothetical protein
MAAAKTKHSKQPKTALEAPDAWQDAYSARFDGSHFGNDAIGLFALGLQFNLEDLDAIGAESVTGGGDDKKCDLFYFDREESRCVIAQCYVAQKPKSSAPANKSFGP